MGFKLSVSDVIDVPVKGTLTNASKRETFSFTLQAKRMTQAEYREVFGDGATALTRDVLQERIVGWRDQRLVLDDDSGQPASFSAEALDCLLTVTGMEFTVAAAYVKALVAADSLAGRAGN